MAYTWSKRGVHRLVRREAVPFGEVGARICSVTPGIIDTPMGRQEGAAHAANDLLVQLSPIKREGRTLQLRADMFNSFNRTNFGIPGTSTAFVNTGTGTAPKFTANSTAGQITSIIGSSRQFQISARFAF